jgi:hypothetical protein
MKFSQQNLSEPEERQVYVKGQLDGDYKCYPYYYETALGNGRFTVSDFQILFRFFSDLPVGIIPIIHNRKDIFRTPEGS